MQNCLSHCLLLLFEIIFGIINEMVRTFYRDTEQVASFLFVWTILSAYIIFVKKLTCPFYGKQENLARMSFRLLVFASPAGISRSMRSNKRHKRGSTE